MFLTLKGANGLNGLALNNWFSSRKQFTARGTKSLTSYFPQKRKGSLNSPVFPDHRKAQPKILSANLWEKCRFSFDLYWAIQGAMKRMKSKLYLQLCNWQKKKKSWDKEDVQFHPFYSILNRKLENQWELIATCFLHKTGWKITLFNYYIWWQPHWQHCQHQILEKTSKKKSFFSTSPNQKANQNPDSCYFHEYFVLCTHLFKYMCKIPLFICITWT